MANSYSFKDIQCSVMGQDGSTVALSSGVPEEDIKVEMPAEMRLWDGHPVSVAEYECLTYIHELYVRLYGREPKGDDIRLISPAGRESVLHVIDPKPLETVMVTVVTSQPAEPAGESQADRIARITREMCGG